MKKVIIAEKPNIGTTIVRAIGGNFEKKSGYFENENYIVTFGYGHLFELYSMGDYLNAKIRWHLEQLPFVPSEYQFKLKETNGEVDKGIEKQFNTIKKLVNRKDVDTIINCCDADREGQVIGHIIISKALESNKPIKRLWLPEQTEESIREGLNNLKDDSEYNNLLDEGLVRTYVDWLYGINLTQLVSCKKGTLLPVGRVIIPIVEVIEKRDRQIENFVPTTYYQAELTIIKDDTSIKLIIDEKFENESDCKALVEKLKGKRIFVKEIEKKDVIKQPKKLFSLDKLQNKLSKNFKLSASESLKIIQGLYEKGYVTYPRTNTEYLAEEEKDKVKKIIDAFNKDSILEFKDKKTIFDSSKIESHSAIIPTTKVASDLQGMELNVYNTIVNRFLSNFLVENTILSETNIIFDFEGYLLKIKGTAIKQKGFLVFENDMKEKSIPNFEKGEIIEPNVEPVEKQTQPPKHITLPELNNYLKNPFKKDDMTDDEEYSLMLQGVEIGTVATRGDIIEKSCKNGYIVEKKGTFYIGEKGKELIKALNDLKIDMYKDKTVELSKILKKVYTQELTKDEAMKIYSQDLINIVNNAKAISVDKIELPKVEKEIIGKCPKCKKNIYESEKSFYCEGYKDNPKCNFTLWKNSKFFEDKGKKLTKTIAKALLKDNKAKVSGLKKKDGSGTYTAIISMEVGEKYTNFKMTFDTKKKN